MAEQVKKTAIITGASRGIGAAIAERLSRDGFNIVINYSGDPAPADALALKLQDRGGTALAVKADVGQTEAVKQLFDATEAAFGGIDVLVNNAGIMALAPLAEMDDKAFDRLINVNIKGSFNTMRAAAQRLRTGGSIVNFSSSVVGLLQPGYGVYAATKAAVEAMTAVLTKELRGRNITVNAIAPGPTATDLFLHGKSPELIQHITRMTPLERLGQPEDIAATVSFLVSRDGGWINGQTIRANGGII